MTIEQIEDLPTDCSSKQSDPSPEDMYSRTYDDLRNTACMAAATRIQNYTYSMCLRIILISDALLKTFVMHLRNRLCVLQNQTTWAHVDAEMHQYLVVALFVPSDVLHPTKCLLHMFSQSS